MRLGATDDAVRAVVAARAGRRSRRRPGRPRTGVAAFAAPDRRDRAAPARLGGSRSAALARRNPVGRQRHHRRVRLPDPVRFPRAGRQRRGDHGRRDRAAVASGRVRPGGQDRHHGVRLLLPRPHRQSGGARAHTRRIVERVGGRCGRRSGAAGAGLADRGLGHPTGRLLRGGGAGAHPRPAAHRRGHRARAQSGQSRVLHRGGG
ncbi:Uncharacterised protein [Mycobacteroides abscessus subsp. abscessus]|nr:Uncharacterised protein [Mycobacteroides abscessus subsp. abscessus]